MHLLIPFAFCSSEGCRQALAPLKLPNLDKLLRRLTPEPIDQGFEDSLSPPHERALARALGLPIDDGLIPWAALQAKTTLGATAASRAWAFITPCHWRTGAKHVAMGSLPLPDFEAQESTALLASMQPYFLEDGISLYYEQPDRWLACSDVFNGLATASPDRVLGRDVAHWLPADPSAMGLQRLQSEMQMLLYHHPVNDAREARSVPVVNSFWISGTGALPPLQHQGATAPEPVWVTRLREAALAEDWPAWAQAWQTLDATECAALLATLNQGQGASLELTLCGERSAQTFKFKPTSILQRFSSLLGSQPSSLLLEQL
ncbi:MAG: phosphoglycerate mutase [Gammaproteobacteria bacterium]|uniref:phosphoglycerate mutase n=1 Tax=Rhodoferax sp. TaxID=50421 RepID=UPI00184FE0C5|nr:phosphoglycerate mutase [Rhodoferax sp.]MBU3900353.1 phosphoglycerate mutase [Gammaproteobacteria bacterium]MBA3058459.1 phosphoglycerate mutase [Rhodoferax sp.]MBU3998008.1 phosphoglycerate mutase [Gammaproteobacteria bacterium]MBU4018940.1 phosphoglycerate mutase [Gammaproteobacteria bacterium]MBU4080930.1 phosphoglycerate mutase [Gammaproteobacteria bacterium]